MDLSNIKIVFIDIDGTLVDDNKKISSATKKSIKRLVDKGIYVVLVSGRDVIHTIDKSKKACASSIVIASNGSEIFDYNKKEYIFHDVFDFDKIVKTWNYCMENEFGLILKSNKGVYYNNYSLVKKGTKYKHISDVYKSCKSDVSQLLLMSTDNDKIKEAAMFIRNLGLYITSYSSSYLIDPNRNYNSLDVNNANISKGTAIDILLKHLNIRKEDSLCFGDFINDMSMFDICGVKVAMGNAIDELKERADYVTQTNNENGVANFLDKYF